MSVSIKGLCFKVADFIGQADSSYYKKNKLAIFTFQCCGDFVKTSDCSTVLALTCSVLKNPLFHTKIKYWKFRTTVNTFHNLGDNIVLFQVNVFVIVLGRTSNATVPMMLT